jgi:centromere-localized protein 2
MRAAIVDIGSEIAQLEAQTASLLDEIRTTVGDLSDLRYGKFPNRGSDAEEGDAAREIVEGIRRVEMVCGEKMELDGV